MKSKTLLQSTTLITLCLASGALLSNHEKEQKEKEQKEKLSKEEAHIRAVNKKCQTKCKKHEKCCLMPLNGDSHTHCAAQCSYGVLLEQEII